MEKAIVVFSLLACWCCPADLFGQKARVRNKADFSPVKEVFVFDKKHKKSVLSDSLGYVLLDEFLLSDTLIFQHPSFHAKVTTKAKLEAENYVVVLEEKVVDLNEFVIAASRMAEPEEETPQRIRSIGAGEIQLSNTSTTADLLQKEGNILVQKSQGGGGSPVVRGFEANKVLLVIDGVRMNNAIYRSGHLQNSITIDQAVLERTEVVFGPNSVMYGSDALGGVIHFQTKDPELGTDSSGNYQMNAFTRYGSVNNEVSTHLDINSGFEKFGFLTSITASKFGDARMGSVRHPDYPEWGKVYHYADRINGQDTMIRNPDPEVQIGTGYRQYDLMEKVRYVPDQNQEYILNLQYSTSSDIPRFDKLNDYSDGQLKYAEWNYGPQNRLFAAFKGVFKKNNRAFDRGEVTFSFQDIRESRVTRRFENLFRVHRIESVKVLGLNADFAKAWGPKSKLNYGIEVMHNDVASDAFAENIETGARGFASTRYPDGGSTMQTAAVYAGYKHEYSEKLILHLGARYSYVLLNSVFEDTTLYSFPYEDINISTGAPTGNAGIVFRPGAGFRISALVSTGFRTPNVDDYGKVFAKSDNVVVPNDDLQPEYAYNGELSVEKTFAAKRIELKGTAYYTLLENALVRREAQLNGEDSILYDGVLHKVQTNKNAGQAVITGASFSGRIKFTENINAFGAYTYTFGKDVTANVPLGHISPVFGRVALNYDTEKLKTSFYAFYNGWKKAENYSPSGVDNEEEATPEGTPAWYTLNLNVNYRVVSSVLLQFAVENMFNYHYKQFASGVSGPGRNFVFTLRVSL